MTRSSLRKKLQQHRILVACAVVVVFLAASERAYAWYAADRILPHVRIGTVELGTLNRDQAAAALQAAVANIEQANIHVSVEGKDEVIDPDSISFDMNIGEAVDLAYGPGHTGTWLQRLWDRTAALWSGRRMDAPVHLDQNQLAAQIEQISQAAGVPRRDIRLQVQGTTVTLATDTAKGRTLNTPQVAQAVTASLVDLDITPVSVSLTDDLPVADPASGMPAVSTAKKIVSRPLTLRYQEMQYTISREKLASWLISIYNNDQLQAIIDPVKIASYVTNVAGVINVAPQPPQIQTQDGRVTSFEPSKVGIAVQEDKLVSMIAAALNARTGADTAGDVLTVPVASNAMALSGLDSAAGITEIIGTATTPFTGSPKNRILNIKNGVKFLSGTVIEPGEEFSTLKTLGTIDNTTGYLPELVIKGDRTQPDFGGGLCQVSTTLFRAVLNAGLPVTERHNHSYRVSYYEKDGDGNLIGPGLDATIYDPDLDFKFKNDTDHAILIIGYVVADKITFQLYGTKDGRVAAIDGPHKLTETPPGETKYIPEPTLALGVKKQVETPHPGGTAIATYSITYPDGHIAKQVFHSYYRPWPAQFLVGTGGVIPTLTPSPSPSPTP